MLIYVPINTIVAIIYIWRRSMGLRQFLISFGIATAAVISVIALALAHYEHKVNMLSAIKREKTYGKESSSASYKLQQSSLLHTKMEA